jgi:Putative peptidoglycan binding domain/Transglycosylase SLT domain
MSHAMLRLNDGRDDTSPQLRTEVEALQTELNQHGFDLKVDGEFVAETDSALRRFQQEQGLIVDGVAGAATWAALEGRTAPDSAKIIETVISSSDVEMNRQLTEALKYRASITQASQKFGIEESIIGGLGSRESHWGLLLKPPGPGGTGDFAKRRSPAKFRSGPLPPDNQGFGRGLMQIDFDANEFARTGNWQDPTANILCGAEVLSVCGKTLQRLKPGLEGTALQHAALAAYNCGPGNVLNALRDGRDPNFYTAGHDYGKDVLSRAGFFQIKGWS